jgi:polysaccharide pyruvyl transferase WcaK-like protein
LWQQGYTLHNFKEQRRVKYEGCVLVYANSIDNVQSNAKGLNTQMDLLPNPDIPVLVLSIGAQNSSFDYFQLRPQMMNALSKLERRATKIFLRGDYTLNLLKHNNVPNISKYVSLGCPSMLLQDIDWEKHASKWSSLTEESNIAIAIPGFSQSKYYLNQLIPYSKRPNVYTIVQTMPRVIKFAKGAKSGTGWFKDLGVADTEFDAIVSNQKNFKSFTDIKEYMTFLEDIDFCIGTRIHATIAGILSGTPSLCLALDSRTLELCQKMHIPHVDCTSPVDIGDIFDFIKNNYNIIPNKIQGHVDFMRETYCKEIESSFKPGLAMKIYQKQAI